MSKYQIGDKVFVPYGTGDRGTIIDIKKRWFFATLYVIHSDTYVTMDVLYRYYGWHLSRVPGRKHD